jgi:predicted transcriptional regulator
MSNNLITCDKFSKIMKEQKVMLSVVSLILEVSSNNDDDAKKKTITTTKIMYNTLLNHPRLKEYWSDLTELGLLEYDITTNTFKTTEKGLRFLEVFSELDQRAREEQQEKKKNDNHSISKA